MEMLKTILASMDAHHTRMDAMHKKMMARMDAWLTDTKDNQEETMTCQKKTEVRLEEEEPTSVEMKPEVADEEVPKEDAAVMSVGEPRKRRRDRNLAAERRQNKLHKRT
jgi:hypothetical protein